MQQTFKEAKNLINQSNNILLTMHERMDGDDGGSVLAFANYLKPSGKKITCAIKYGVPPNLTFLPGSQCIQDQITKNDFDLIVTFGCSTLNRTGLINNVDNLKTKIINIDHHPDNEMFGTINIVDPKKSSVAEIVYDFFIYQNWQIDSKIATCLLTGIIADTGSFLHSNTHSTTLKVAADLVRKGGHPHSITKNVNKSKNAKILKAWGKAIENFFYDEQNKIIISIITEKDFEEIGELPKAAFEGMAEILNTVPEAKFSLFLKQDGPLIKGSLRSETEKSIDVSKIAKLFGGGGHKLAAGFSIAGKLVKNEQGKWKIK